MGVNPQTYFLSFCIEQYKTAKGMDGGTVAKLFMKKGVDKYLLNNFDVLHTQSYQWLVQDIDDYINSH